MVGLFGWIEQNTGLNVSNYDFDDSGNVVGYTDSAVGVSVPSSSGSISASDISRVQDSGTGTVTETVVLEKRGNNYIVEDAFGNILTIPKGDFVDFKRNNDRDLEMIAGEATPSDRDELRQMEAVQERAEMGESAYAKKVRESESDGPYYGVAVGDTSSDVGTIKQDASGNWYTVVKNPNSNTVGKDYSIDPQDNSQGPTFGGNVSDYVAETFSDEVAAAGGSTEEPEFIGFTQLLENIVTGETTDVPSVGFDAETGTFETGAAAAVTEPTFDEAFAAAYAQGPGTTFMYNGELKTALMPGDDPEFDAAMAGTPDPVIPTGGPGTFVPGSLPAAEYSSLTVGDPLTPQLALELGLSDIYQEGDTILPQDLVALNDLGFDVDQKALSGIDLQTGADAGTITVDTVGGANNVTDALLNLTGEMGAGDIGADEALATLNLIEGNDLTDADVAALLPPAEPALSGVEKQLVENHGFIDNGDGTLTHPTNGYFYDYETGGYTEDFDKTEDLNAAQTVSGYDDLDGALTTVTDTSSTAVKPSITSETLADLKGYVDSLTSMQGGYTEADLEAAGFTAAEIAAFEQGLDTGTLTDQDVSEMQDQFGTLQEAPNTLESMANAIKGGSDLTLGEIASGLGYDTVGGFMEELALSAQGTGKMGDDALNLLAEVNLIPGAEVYINPEYSDNLTALQDMNALDQLALENQAAAQGVSVASLLDPTISATTGESIPMTLSEADITLASDAMAPVAKLLTKAQEKIFEAQAENNPEYLKVVSDGMPDPDNEGYNMAGEPITPGLWMASVAAQELLGLGLDVLTIAALGPVAGGAVVAGKSVGEAGKASANEVVAEFEELKASGALDHLSEEEYDTLLDTAETQAFYTSGLAGGAVDTLVALTAGGFAPLSKALPTAINSALTGLGVLGAEGVSGGLEQVGVNAAVIQALEDQGIDPADYDKGYLDQVITAAIYETVGGTGASAASTVGSAVQNLSAKPGDTTSQTGTQDKFYDAFGNEFSTAAEASASDLALGVGGTLTGDETTVADLTASEILESGENVTVSTDSAGNLVLTDNDTNESVTVGSSFSTGDTLTGGETKVSDLQGTEDAVIGGTDQNVVVSNVGGNLTLTNEDTGFTAVVGAGTNANLINATNAVQNSDADAAVAAGATVGDTTASETLLGGTDTNVDLGFEGLSDADTTDAESSLEGKTTIVTDGVTTQYENGKIVKPLSEVVGTGTGGIGTIATGTGDVTTGVTGTGDANTTITANNDATVTTSSDGNVTITTATDSQGNAVVTTKNNVTGETTTDNVAVNNTAVVTNSGVTVNVNAAVDGTTTTTTETPQAGVSSEVEGVVDVGTTADAITQAATTTTVEQPQTIVDQPQTIVDQPQTLVAQPQPAVAAPTSYTPPDSDGDPTTDPVGETQPGYTSGIADLGAGGRMRPVVAPYYQPQQTGLYSFYRPQPGVDQIPAAPVFNEPTSYLSPTGGLRYGNPYIGTNLSIEQLRELAELQGTGAAVLPSEDLMNGS